MKTFQMSFVMSGLAAVLVFACTSEEATNVQSPALPDYEIINEETYDAPVKTQVEQHILVSGEIDGENLKALLRQQFDLIMQQRGFEYHDAPTNVYIYAYETRKRAEAEQGLWLAMLQMSPTDNGEPQITVREEQIARIGLEPEEKYGLPEAQRKEVFKEIVAAEDRVTEEAMEREPSNIDRQIDLERELGEKYKDELARKYNLSKEELASIGIEA